MSNLSKQELDNKLQKEVDSVLGTLTLKEQDIFTEEVEITDLQESCETNIIREFKTEHIDIAVSGSRFMNSFIVERPRQAVSTVSKLFYVLFKPFDY
jgi:hypothetical protein